MSLSSQNLKKKSPHTPQKNPRYMDDIGKLSDQKSSCEILAQVSYEKKIICLIVKSCLTKLLWYFKTF